MPKPLKRNAVIVFGLAILFYWSFMFAKHDPALRTIIPFGDDPYDAVGSFAAISGVLLALLSMVRAFRPYGKPPSEAQRVYLIRSQHAVVLAVLMTLAADVIAMARHPHLWAGTASRNLLIALLAGLGVVAFGVQRLIRLPQPEAPVTGSARLGKALLPAMLALLVLAIYPEDLIRYFIPHLLTIIVGDCVLFAPMPLLLAWLVPYQPDAGRAATIPEGRRILSAGWRWGLVAAGGIVIGVFVFLGEISEGSGSMPLVRLLFVASVFIGLCLAGLFIAYAFLGAPLGLGSRG